MPDRTDERLRAARNDDEVHAVCHQAVGDDRQAVTDGFPGEKVEIGAAVVIDEKDIQPVVAALDDMMRQAGSTMRETRGMRSGHRSNRESSRNR